MKHHNWATFAEESGTWKELAKEAEEAKNAMCPLPPAKEQGENKAKVSYTSLSEWTRVELFVETRPRCRIIDRVVFNTFSIEMYLRCSTDLFVCAYS